MQTTFDLGPKKKKMVLQSAGAKWREFKSRLTTLYVLPYKDDPESTQFPPDDLLVLMTGGCLWPKGQQISFW